MFYNWSYIGGLSISNDNSDIFLFQFYFYKTAVGLDRKELISKGYS